MATTLNEASEGAANSIVQEEQIDPRTCTAMLTLPAELREELYAQILTDHEGNAPPALAQANLQLRDELLSRFYSTHVFKFEMQDREGTFEGREKQHIATAKAWCDSIGNDSAKRVQHIDGTVWMEPHISPDGRKCNEVIPIDMTWSGDFMQAKLAPGSSGRGNFGGGIEEVYARKLKEVNERAIHVESASGKLAMVFDIFQGSHYYI